LFLLTFNKMFKNSNVGMQSHIIGMRTHGAIKAYHAGVMLSFHQTDRNIGVNHDLLLVLLANGVYSFAAADLTRGLACSSTA
jgi:hypothetical protein